MRFSFLALLPAVLVWGCSDNSVVRFPTGFNNVFTVPGDFANPQDAVDAAQAGDLVWIEPGVYTALETRDVDPQEFPDGLTAALFLKPGVWVWGGGDAGDVVFRDTTGAVGTCGAALIFTDDNTGVRNISFENYFYGSVARGGNGFLTCNRFAGCAIGVWSFRAEGPVVLGNLVEDCVFDGILNQYADAVIYLNMVRRCAAGVGAERPGNALVQENILCLNQLGAASNTDATPVFYRNFVIDNSVFGFMFASGAVPIAVENDIYGSPVGIFTTAYSPPLSDSLDCTSNYWSTTELDSIAGGLIRDNADDASAGVHVEYLPVLPTSVRPVTRFYNFDVRERCINLPSPEAMRLLDQVARAGILERYPALAARTPGFAPPGR